MPGVMTQPNYNLKNVGIEMNAAVLADITSFDTERKLQVTERTPGRSMRERGTINKEMAPVINCEGWNSDDLAFADLKPGMKITAFNANPTANGDAASFFHADFMTDWPLPWYIGDVSSPLGESDNSKWKFTILCHIDGSYLDQEATTP